MTAYFKNKDLLTVFSYYLRGLVLLGVTKDMFNFSFDLKPGIFKGDLKELVFFSLREVLLLDDILGEYILSACRPPFLSYIFWILMRVRSIY